MQTTRRHPSPALAVSLVALFLSLAATATASDTTRRCGSIHMIATPTAPARGMLVCPGDITPYVYVDGHPLTVADLSDGKQTATFYGWSSIVRVHQSTRGFVAILGETVDPRVRFVIRFQRSS